MKSQLAGDVLIFGDGECSQLGLGEDINQRTRPTLIPTLQDVAVVAAGGLHNLVLAKDGKVSFALFSF